jgi:hypothetical protein
MSNNISNVELEKFKELYKEYIKFVAEFHNTQVQFINGDGFHSSIAIVGPIREMRLILKELRKQAIKVRHERFRNKKLMEPKRGRKPYDKAAEWERKRWLIPPDKL